MLHKRSLLAGCAENKKTGVFLRDYTVHDQFFIPNLPELISQIHSRCSYLQIVDFNQTELSKIVIGNLSQQGETRAVSIKCKLECVLY